jgi:TRAP-type transport system small permease protein
MRNLEKRIRKVTNLISYLGMVMLGVLLLISSFDVLGRYLFNSPIKGTYEISGVLLAGIVFFGWGYTMSVGGHVTVDTFIALFPPKSQAAVGAVNSILAFVIFALMGWQGAKTAYLSWQNHRLIDVINVSVAPFQLFVPIGCLLICLELLVQVLGYFYPSPMEN